MARFLTIAALFAGAGLFGFGIPIAQFSKVLQPLIVAISIMAAGLLVRLNRGMPTLDWKSLEARERKILTEKIVALTREYMFVLFLQAVTLISLLGLALVDADALSWVWQKVALAIVGALVGLSFARMAYIVWRDFDIVRLQKKLIDDSADREALEKASKEALDKVSNIRAAGLRSGPKPEVSGWEK